METATVNGWPADRVISGDQLVWHGNIGSIDMSDMGVSSSWVEPSYIVKSHRTGAEMLFVYKRVVIDSEGDVMFWEYDCDASHEVPIHKPIRIRIFND